MKVARFVLKILAASLAAAATVCCVIAYWDRISVAVRSVCGKCGCSLSEKDYLPGEYDDYADWDME